MKDKDKQNRKELKILRKIYIVKLRELDENDSADNLERSSVKGDSNWIIAVFVDSEYLSTANHFSFAFVLNNLTDLLDSAFQLVDSKGNLISFSETEKKVPVLIFKIKVTGRMKKIWLNNYQKI